MHPIDVVLMKIGEEASEVAMVASQLAHLTFKSIRFGLESHHPTESSPEYTNNENLANTLLEVRKEMLDLEASVLLLSALQEHYQLTQVRGLRPLAAITEKDTVYTRTECMIMSRKLTAYGSFLTVSVDRGLLAEADHQAILTAIDFLKNGILAIPCE